MCLFIPFVAIALICIQALFLLAGATIAKIEMATFWQAVGVVVVGAIGGGAVHLALAGTEIGMILAPFAAFLLEVLVAMAVFDTTFVKALIACVIAWALSLAVLFALFLFMALGG